MAAFRGLPANRYRRDLAGRPAAGRDLTVGTRALPGQVRLNLALAQEHRFGSGVIYLCYHPA